MRDDDAPACPDCGAPLVKWARPAPNQEGWKCINCGCEACNRFDGEGVVKKDERSMTWTK